MKKQQYAIGKPAENSGLVSVIIPVYNAAKYLDMSLKSLLNQTYSYWEAVLVNDGSVDNSLEILRCYAAEDKRFKVIDKENGGVASARNAGLEAAEGDYIAFLDPDDMLYPQFLDILIKSLIKNDAEMAWCKIQRCRENATLDFCGTYENYSAVKVKNPLELFILHRKPRIQISSCAKLYKREILKNVRFNRDFKILAEDYCFSINVFKNVENAVCVFEALLAYRQNDSSLTHRKISNQAVDDHILLINVLMRQLKDVLSRRLRLRLGRRLSKTVFQYCCVFPYFEGSDYKDYWEKYSEKCRKLQKDGLFYANKLPLFYRFLCYLFLHKKWGALQTILKMYKVVRK